MASTVVPKRYGIQCDVYWKAIERNVAYVPGKFFYTRKGEGIETLRLNYTMADETTIKKAIQTLSEVIISAGA